jgi:hypothetical protein
MGNFNIEKIERKSYNAQSRSPKDDFFSKAQKSSRLTPPPEQWFSTLEEWRIT